MTSEKRSRDRVPDRGSVMWRTVSLWRLLITLVMTTVASFGCFWWAGIAYGNKGPGFLVALGALFGCAAAGCLVLVVWHGGARLRQQRHSPS